jgi:hypothetical protein
MAEVQVEFAASSSKGADAAPPILGPGAIEIMQEGVRFRGRRTQRTLAAVIGTVVGVVGVIGAAVALTALDIKALPTRLIFVIGMASGVLPGTLVYRLSAKRTSGAPVDVLVPWSALRALEVAPGRSTLRLVAPALRGDVDVLAKDPAAADVLASMPRR